MLVLNDTINKQQKSTEYYITMFKCISQISYISPTNDLDSAESLLYLRRDGIRAVCDDLLKKCRSTAIGGLYHVF